MGILYTKRNIRLVFKQLNNSIAGIKAFWIATVGVKPVSYTHLDVYKRQGVHCSAAEGQGNGNDLVGFSQTSLFRCCFASLLVINIHLCGSMNSSVHNSPLIASCSATFVLFYMRTGVTLACDIVQLLNMFCERWAARVCVQIQANTPWLRSSPDYWLCSVFTSAKPRVQGLTCVQRMRTEAASARYFFISMLSQ